VIWQHVVLCKSYGVENVPDCGCVSCVVLHESGQCSSLKMIFGSKHVGAILSVLM